MEDSMRREVMEKLEKTYNRALGVCDPIEFQKRQQYLVYEICDCLLEDLRIIREKENPHEALKLFEDKNDK
jgi:hypothetical protein